MFKYSKLYSHGFIYLALLLAIDCSFVRAESFDCDPLLGKNCIPKPGSTPGTMPPKGSTSCSWLEDGNGNPLNDDGKPSEPYTPDASGCSKQDAARATLKEFGLQGLGELCQGECPTGWGCRETEIDSLPNDGVGLVKVCVTRNPPPDTINICHWEIKIDDPKKTPRLFATQCDCAPTA